MSARHTAGRFLFLALLGATVTAACGDRTADDSRDTSGIEMGTGRPGGDTAMSAGMSRTAPHDSNQVFLRMMSDHHEGLIAMSDSALPRTQAADADAQRIREKQQREQQEMLTMLRGTHGDSITPMIMPSNRQMIDSTSQASGTAADTVYWRQVVHHHVEGIGMTEKLLPHLTGDVKQMAEKMLSDQKKEAEELRRKAGMAQ